MKAQPPSGGCVLKPFSDDLCLLFGNQPPSGGCVLKQQPPLKNALYASSRLRAAVC